MFQLSPRNIHLHARAASKEDAIREAGRVLVESGNIDPRYIESMLARESQANTYLGNGIAIPHGLQKDRDFILQTGVSVVQIPDGVEWNDGQIVHILVGIAAKSDEHLEILAALTDVLDDEAVAGRLAKTNDASEIINGLSRRREHASAGSAALAGAESIDLVLPLKAGLHARPATMFSEIAARFSSEIQVTFGEKSASGKSMASLLKLGIPPQGAFRLSAAGPDAAAALKALSEAVAEGLGDEDEPAAPTLDFAAWTPVSDGHAIAGVSASPGLAIGRLFFFRTAKLVVTDTPRDAASEELAFKQAVAKAGSQITAIHDSVQTRAGKAEAAIFRAHLALLNDQALFSDVCTQIDIGHSAAWAWQKAIESRVDELLQIANERLAERAADLHDVGQRVLRLLVGAEEGETQLPDEPVILVTEDLTPSDTARLDPKKILGLCTAGGGPTSHTAIIARSLDIPAVVGAGGAVMELEAGRECILDGTAGRVYIAPDAADLTSAREFQTDLQSRRNAEWETRFQPALMRDGHRVEVVANIGKADEAAAAVEAGAEGVGLMRTEFLFLERQTPPSEDEQYEAYCTMLRALNGLPVILRTLDIGGDKLASYISLPKEENPFLGVRGIRLCLQQPEIFLPQLRAIYRASMIGPVRIMFPMITTLEDLRAAKELAEQVRAEVGVPPVEIGIMVEVPSTVLMAAEFAREVDFFSIGTNDLTQYTLAMDRLHAALAKNVDGLHPAVLRMVDMTVRAAKAAGKWVGVCGGVAGDPLGAAILTGLGVAELSMSLPSIAAVKASLRAMPFSEAENLARRALACSTAPEVRQLVLAS